MKIYICVKHVPDSAATIRITGPDKIDENITFLLNPYDENAIEAAVQLKSEINDSEINDTEIIAVSVSKPSAIDTLRSALAMGADRGVHVVTEDRPDSMVTARALKAAIISDGTPGLILTGKTAIDSDGFQTQFRLAALLDMPVATNVTAIRPQSDTVTVTCALEAGSEQIVRMSLPCIIGAAKTLNTPRYPTFPDIIKARKKEIMQVPLSDLNIPPSASRMEVIGLRPAVEKRQPRIINGPPEKIVSELIRCLDVEAKIKLVS